MRLLASTAMVLALTATAASAQTTTQTQTPGKAEAGPPAQIMTTLPQNAVTVTHWYKQNVYDPNDNKIGEIMDVLVDKSGKVESLIVGVGGFLGAGEKDVAVPFDAVRSTKKGNNDWYLVMNSTKDALKNAKGFKYDRNAMTWMSEDQPRSTTGSGTTRDNTGADRNRTMAPAPGAPATAPQPAPNPR